MARLLRDNRTSDEILIERSFDRLIFIGKNLRFHRVISSPPPPPPSHQNLETRILNEGRELIEESNPKITISIMLSSKEDGIQVLPISCSSSILKKRNEKDDKLMKRYNLPLNYLSLQKWTEWKSESCHECDQALNWFFRSKCCACTNEKNK